MAVVNGSLARKLEFGEDAITVGAPSRLRLASTFGMLRGPDKYKVLDHRRRQAQIKARRLLEIANEENPGVAAPGSRDVDFDARKR
jgi:hypothetical protein